MRSIYFLFFLLTIIKGYSEDSQGWNMVKKSDFLSYTAEFTCLENKQAAGKIIREGLLTPRYSYDLYDSQNTFQARGITRAFSLGSLCIWGTEIDLYDQTESLIGSIEGQFFTNSRAKFVFYDADRNIQGYAYLNNKTADFFLVSGEDQSVVLGSLIGEAFGDVSSFTFSPSEELSLLDERLLKIFTAFASDFHSNFLLPREVKHYHYYH